MRGLKGCPLLRMRKRVILLKHSTVGEQYIRPRMSSAIAISPENLHACQRNVLGNLIPVIDGGEHQFRMLVECLGDSRAAVLDVIEDLACV